MVSRQGNPQLLTVTNLRGRSGRLSDSQAMDLVSDRVELHGVHVARRPFERQLMKNIAFLFGKQHFIQDPLTGRLEDPIDDPPHRVNYKANIMLGHFKRAVETVMETTGSMAIPPKDGSRTARHAAWASEKLLEHLKHRTKWDKHKRIRTSWAALFGSGFSRIAWDPDIGDPVRYYFESGGDGKVLVDPTEVEVEERLQKGWFQDLPAGDVLLEEVSPFQFWWDWRAREAGLEDASWVAVYQVLDIEKLENIYGFEKTRNVAPDDSIEGSLYYNELVSYISASNSVSGRYTREHEEKVGDQTLSVEMFERPSIRNGHQGRYIHYAGGCVLQNRDNPYRSTKYPLPFIKQDWMIAPGRFIGIGLAEHLTSPQFQKNRGMSRIIEHADIYGQPPLLVPKGSGIPSGHWTLEPGMVYERNVHAGPIETGPTPNLSKEAAQVPTMAERDMAVISSQTGLEDSKLPGQIRGLPGLRLMLSEKNKVIAEPASLAQEADQEGGVMMLSLAHQFYPDEQVITYVGEDRRFRTLSLLKADIQRDIRIMSEPDVSSSKVFQEAQVMEWVQAGVIDPINNPEDKEAVFKVFAWGTYDQLVNDRLVEEENQEREIAEMVGDPVRYMQGRTDPVSGQQSVGYPINPDHDDHPTHVKVLLRFMRSEEFRRLDVIAQTLIRQHMQLHQREVQRAQVEQMALMAQLQNVPAQKGQASQPRQTQAAQ